MHHSLVFFTVLCQIAAGSYLLREIFLITGRKEISRGSEESGFLLVITGILFISLFTAFFHLGNPENSVNALRNLGTSWLSREIFFLCTFIASLLTLYIIETKVNYVWVRNLAALVSVITACLLMYSMIRVYMIPSVVSWNNIFTPAGFIITALTGGLSFYSACKAEKIKANDRAVSIILLFLLPLSIIVSISFNSLHFKSLPVLLLLRVILALSAIAILVMKYFLKLPNKNGIWPVIVFIIVSASEIINRYIFYLSFEKSGL